MLGGGLTSRLRSRLGFPPATCGCVLRIALGSTFHESVEGLGPIGRVWMIAPGFGGGLDDPILGHPEVIDPAANMPPRAALPATRRAGWRWQQNQAPRAARAKNKSKLDSRVAASSSSFTGLLSGSLTRLVSGFLEMETGALSDKTSLRRAGRFCSLVG